MAEPKFTTGGKSHLIDGLNYYSYHSEPKYSKLWSIEWLNANNLPHEAARLAAAPDYLFSNRGFFCRMISRGFVATDEQIASLVQFFKDIVVEKAPSLTHPDAQAKPKVTPVKRKRMNTSQQNLDVVLDDVCHGKPSSRVELEPNRADLEDVIEFCKGTLKELVEYREAYRVDDIAAMRLVLKDTIASAEKLLLQLTKTQHKVTASAPAKVNPATMIRAVKFKLKEDTLNIRSVPLSNVIGAKKMYLYDTKLRKIMLLQSATAQGFAFSGTTIKNWDPTKSSCKTLRKPDVFFNSIGGSSATMSVINKAYESNSSNALPVLTGRTNENLIFIKVSEQ